MATLRSLGGLLLGLGLLTSMGCAVDPPPTPAPALSKDQVKDLVKCQEAIKKQGANFIKLKLQKLEQCADDVLELQLELENDLITQEKFDTVDLPKVRAKCVKNFEKITAASTKLVDKIIEACEPVEDVLLGANDPLAFQGLMSVIGLPTLTSTEELAGFICIGKELFVDMAVSLEVPRLHQVLSILGSEFVIEAPDEPFFLPAIPLDPRCPPLVSAPPTFMGLSGALH